MDWEAQKRERDKQLREERRRLIEMSEAAAASLPVPEWYQRMRYLREIEGYELRERLNRGNIPTDKPMKRRYTSTKSRIDYVHD